MIDLTVAIGILAVAFHVTDTPHARQFFIPCAFRGVFYLCVT